MNNVVLIGRLTKDPEIRQVGETMDRYKIKLRLSCDNF
jgi:single-stranded DNA-binding protein